MWAVVSEDYTPTMADLREAYVLNRVRNIDSLLAPGTSSKDLEDKGRADANAAIAAHDAELREQIAREIQSRLPKLLADDSENEDGWLSDWDGQVWPAADDTRVDLTGDGSIDLDHIASHAVSIAQGKE